MVLFKARRYSDKEIEAQCQQMDEGADEKITSDNAPAVDIPTATVHLKIKDGRTRAEHEIIVAEILECAHVDPDDLLAEHRHLVG